MKKLYAVLVVLALVLTVTLLGIRKVDTGQIGVVTRFGEVKETRTTGLTWVIPFVEKVNKIKVTQTKVDSEHSVSTKDMQTVSLVIATQYSINPEKAPELFFKFLNNHEDAIIIPTIKEAVQSSASQFTIEGFVSNRNDLSSLINDRAKEVLESYGINVIAVDILDHDFSDAYEQAVEAKKTAEQNTLKAQQELETAKIEAEKRKLEAESFSSTNFKMEFLKKWDGKMPQVVGESSVIMDLINEGIGD